MIQNGKYYVELSLRKLISPLSAVRFGVTDFPAANEKKKLLLLLCFAICSQNTMRPRKLFDLLELKKIQNL